jgi:Nuclease-related domain
MSSAENTDARVDFAGIQALSSREAGYSVALKCLQVQAEAEVRDPSLRTDRRVALHEDAWSWYTGALGEIEVGEMLKALGPDWFVRHSVPIGAGTKDVDHLVIGPGGVFAINTKHHRGASVWVGDHVLRVNNANTPHLKIARSDAHDVARRLAGKVGFPVPVTAVIAVLNASSIVDRRAPLTRSVSVVNATKLTAWLLAQPQQLNDSALALLKLAAEEPETWHIDPRAADTLRVMPRFERLAAQVGTPGAPRAPSKPLRGPARRSPTRRNGVATPARSTARPTASSAGRKPLPARALRRMWFAVGLIISAILIVRGVADQPCTSTITCVVPVLYLGFKPLLILVGIGAFGAAVIKSLITLARRSSL